jgi:hypothetical protein
MANKTEITTMAGQKILCSGRAAIISSPGETKMNNGAIIKAKTHAEIGMIAHWSMIALGAGPLKAGRPAPWVWRVP